VTSRPSINFARAGQEFVPETRGGAKSRFFAVGKAFVFKKNPKKSRAG
jgi:hypothetical protein